MKKLNAIYIRQRQTRRVEVNVNHREITPDTGYKIYNLQH